MRVEDHYARALPCANLRMEERTTASAPDLLAAAGFSRAGPFAAASLRFLVGDRSSAAPLLQMCRQKAIGRAWHEFRRRLDEGRGRDRRRRPGLPSEPEMPPVRRPTFRDAHWRVRPVVLS